MYIKRIVPYFFNGFKLTLNFLLQTKTFLCKTLKERTNLKWKFLMERCAVRLVAFPFMQGRQVISIVNMSPVSPFEVAGKIHHM